MMKKLAYLLVFLLLAAYLATGVYQVRPGELAVVRRFGKVLEQPRLPGLNIGLPWGVDQVDLVAVDEQRLLSVGFYEAEERPRDTGPVGQLLTGDNHLIDARVTVYYRVERDQVVDFVLNAKRAESILSRAAEQALAATLASERVDAVLLGQARELELRLKEDLSKRLRAYRLGLAVESVNVIYAQPPAELAEVFREVNRARTLRENARTEAERWRETEVSAARSKSRQTLADAQAAARDRVTRAAAEADAFRSLARSAAADPNGVLFTLYLKDMQAILSRFQVRTVTDQNVEQTIVLPGGRND